MAAGLTLAACSADLPETRPAYSLKGEADSNLPLDDVSDPYERGKAHFRRGQMGLALSSFTAALTANGRSVALLNAIAATYDRLGRFDLSERYYGEALALAPDSAQTQNNLGFSLLLQGRREEAMQHLQIARQTGTEDDGLIAANIGIAERTTARPGPVATRPGITQISGAAPSAPSAANGAAGAPDPGRASPVRLVAVPPLEITPTSEGAYMLTTVSLPARLAALPPAEAAKGSNGVSAAPPLGAGQPVSLLPKSLSAKSSPAPQDGDQARLRGPDQPSVARPGRPDPVAGGQNPQSVHAAPVRPLIEIAHGAGRSAMAERMMFHLARHGVEIRRSTGDQTKANARTVVHYRRDFAAQARQIGSLLPEPVLLAQDTSLRTDIRLRLGQDLLDFDVAMQFALEAMRTDGVGE